MNQETIKAILLQNRQLQMPEILEFVSDYVKLMKNEDITSEQLNGIMQVLQMGIFDLRHAAIQAGIKVGMNIFTLYDKNGQLVKTYIK